MHARGVLADNRAAMHLEEGCCSTLKMFGRTITQQAFSVCPPNSIVPRVDQQWLPSALGRVRYVESSSPILRARPTTVSPPFSPTWTIGTGEGRGVRRRGSALVTPPSNSRMNRPSRGPRTPRPCDEQQQQQQQLLNNGGRKRNSLDAPPTSCRAIEGQEKHYGNVLREDDAVIAGKQRTFVRTVEKLGVGRRGDEIVKLMERTATDGSPPFNLYMYNACITALARSGRWRQAVAVLDSMRRADVEGNADDYLATSNGRVVIRPDVVSYSAAITALGKGRQRHQALELLRKMREEGVAPNVVTYNAAAHACIVEPNGSSSSSSSTSISGSEEPQQEEGWSLILGLMKEMRADGISPDAFTFSTAITACGRAGRWELALDLLDEMATSAGHHQPQRSTDPLTIAAAGGVVPDIVAINAAITACGRAGQWQHALDLLGRITARVPAAYEWSASTDSNVRDGSFLRLTDLDNKNVSVAAILKDEDQVFGSDVGSRMGLGLQGSDSIDDVVGGVDAPCVAAHPSLWPSADVVSFNAAMEACARAGRWQKGVALLPFMRAAGIRPDIRTYAAVLACFRVGGQWESALELLEKMEDVGFSNGGREDVSHELVIPDIGCYGVVMSALGEAGEWERALELLRRLQRRGEIGKTLTVAELPHTGPGAASTATAGGPNLVCYNAVLLACARAGAPDPALALLEEMEGLGVFDVASFNCVMRACRGQGQWRKATELLDRMVRGDRTRGSSPERILPRPDVYSFSSVITACGASGQAKVAVELLRGMRNAPGGGVEPNVVVYNAAIATFVQAVNWPGTAAEDSGIGFSCEDSLGEGNKGDVITMEASKQAEEKNRSWRSVQALVSEMRKNGISPNVETYNTVLAVCQRAGAWESALEVLGEMKRGQKDEKGSGKDVPYPDVISFNTAIGACGKAGRWCEALELLEEMSKRGLKPDAISYNAAAAACAREKVWDIALGVIDRGRQAGVFKSIEEDSERLGTRKRRIGRELKRSGQSLDAGRFHAALEALARRKC